MSAITVNASQIAPIFPHDAEIFDFIADEATTGAQAAYFTTSGGVGLADADDTAKDEPRGVTLSKAGVGQGVSVLKRGHVAGFNVSGLAYDAPIYLSATPGGFDTAGSIKVGRVVGLSDSARTKVVYIDCPWV